MLISSNALSLDGKILEDFVLKKEVVDKLDSDAENVPLSAKQGKFLKSVIDTKAPIDSPTFTGEVSGISKEMVGLGNVTNDPQVKRREIGTANGVVPTDENNLIPSQYPPSYVDDVLEFDYRDITQTDGTAIEGKSYFPLLGESGKIYVDISQELTYRWSGTQYIKISKSLALGETSSTAYAGAKGKKNTADISSLQKNKANKIDNATAGNIVTLTATGDIADSGKGLDDVGKVKSVFGRDGEVVAKDGDYKASQISCVPAKAIQEKNVQGVINYISENYLPEKITGLAGAKSYEYAAPMASVARPSFVGRTMQEGTPEPDNPAAVKGVLNPWVKATGEDGTTVTKQLTAELFEGDSFDGVNLMTNGTVSRHDMDLPLSSNNYTIEAGDENGLLESVSIEILPDSAVYGRRVYPYRHIKEGTVHKLTGTPGAAQIIFNAADTYQDGDTWTLNGAAVSVTYADGQTLLPNAVIAGDAVQAVVEREAVKHIAGVIMPEENLLYNWDFRGPTYTFDKLEMVGSVTAEKQAGYIMLNFGDDTSTWGDFRHLYESAELVRGKELTFSALCRAATNESYIFMNAHTGSGAFSVTKIVCDGQWRVVTCTGIVPDMSQKLSFTINGNVGAMEIACIKVEIGPRFTGWHEPKPGETLAECQRCLLRNSPGNTVEIRASYVYNGGINFIIPIPITMRTSPAISTALENSVIEVRNMSNAAQSGFTFSTVALPGAIKITASKVNHGLSDAFLVIRNVLFTGEL